MVTASYHRFFAQEEREFDTVDEAVDFLAEGENSGDLSSHTSVIRDGDRVIAGEELHRLVYAAWDKLL